MKDPEEKTKFYREIAKKLCGFSEEVERENYIQAVADKYGMALKTCGSWCGPTQKNRTCNSGKQAKVRHKAKGRSG